MSKKIKSPVVKKFNNLLEDYTKKYKEMKEDLGIDNPFLPDWLDEMVNKLIEAGWHK